MDGRAAAGLEHDPRYPDPRRAMRRRRFWRLSAAAYPVTQDANDWFDIGAYFLIALGRLQVFTADQGSGQ